MVYRTHTPFNEFFKTIHSHELSKFLISQSTILIRREVINTKGKDTLMIQHTINIVEGRVSEASGVSCEVAFEFYNKESGELLFSIATDIKVTGG